MLNLFPIQWLALLAYFILRVGVGGVFLYLVHAQIKNWKQVPATINLPIIKNGKVIFTFLIMTELIIGALYIIGLATQAAALLAIALCIKILFWYKRFPTGSIPAKLTYVLILFASLSLFITGAGALAFDLPI